MTNDKSSGVKVAVCEYCNKEFVPYGILVPGTPDCLCQECARKFLNTAKIVCNKCRKIVGRLEPQVTDTGYYIRPNSVLHVRECIQCNPLLRSSAIVELEDYYNALMLTSAIRSEQCIGKTSSNTTGHAEETPSLQ